jgi:hypothetical protein
MNRKPRLTKRERKALAPARSQAPAAGGGHIHCIACGAHLDPAEFQGAVATATMLRCQHGSTFASCTTCVPTSERLLAEHDRTGQAVKTAAAWH